MRARDGRSARESALAPRCARAPLTATAQSGSSWLMGLVRYKTGSALYRMGLAARLASSHCLPGRPWPPCSGTAAAGKAASVRVSLDIPVSAAAVATVATVATVAMAAVVAMAAME
eukprot:4991308-Pleurochrysis_carterae.AAC.2